MASVPMDGGWAWMVVVGAMMVNFFVIGFFKSIGILFVEIREVFESSAAITALMMGIIGGAMSIVAPFGTALGERIGQRRVVMFGGLLCASGAFFASFADNVVSFTLLIGILTGLGYGCQLCNCLVCVGQYFEKRRALANGLAMSGGSLGCLLIPIIMRLLIDAFTFRGALLIYSALVLHQVVGGALFRPTSFYSDSSNAFLEMSHDEKDAISDKSNHSTSMQVPASCCECHDRQESVARDEVSMSKLSAVFDDVSIHAGTVKGTDDERSTQGDLMEPKWPRAYHLTNGKDGTESLLGLTGSIMTQQCDCSCHLVDTNSEQIPITKSNSSNSVLKRHSSREMRRDQGTLLESCMASFCFCCRKKDGVKPLLDWSILKDPLFCTFVFAICFCNIGYVTSYNFLPPLCEENGISKQATAIIMSFGGVVDLIGRAGGGWFADFNFLKKSHLMAGSILISGCATLIFPFYINIYTVYVLVFFLGVFGGTYVSMMAVVLADFVGFERMPNAFGLAIMFLGMSNIGMPSFFGYIKDKSRYGVIYHITGSFMMLGSMFLFSEPLARRIRERQLRKKQAHRNRENDLTT